MLYACSKFRSYIRLKLMFLFFNFAIANDVCVWVVLIFNHEFLHVWRVNVCDHIDYLMFTRWILRYYYSNGEMLWHVNMRRWWCACIKCAVCDGWWVVVVWVDMWTYMLMWIYSAQIQQMSSYARFLCWNCNQLQPNNESKFSFQLFYVCSFFRLFKRWSVFFPLNTYFIYISFKIVHWQFDVLFLIFNSLGYILWTWREKVFNSWYLQMRIYFY